MKRRILALTACLWILCILPTQLVAACRLNPDRTEVVIPTALGAQPQNAENRPVVFTRTVDRTQIMLDEFDRPVWKFTVRGTFTYNGETVMAIDSKCFQEVYNSDWACTAQATSHTGSSVEGGAIFEKNWLGVPVLIKTPSMRIHCDAEGNIS